MKDAVKNFFEGKISRNDFLKVFVNSLKKRCFLNGEFPNLTNIIEHDTEKILPDFCEFFPKIRTLGYIPLKYGTDDKEHVALFAVTCAKDLSERSYRRKQFDFAQKIADLPGQIRIWFDTNNSYPGNAIFLFIAPDGKSFRLSLIERDKSKEKKIFKRYTFFVSADQSNRTFFARIGSDKNKKWETFSDLRDTFSVEKLSDDFFKAYTETHYQDFVSYATGVRMGYKGKKWVVISRTDPNQEIMEQFATYADPDKALRDYVKKMMGRLVFLQFLQKKGWLGVPEGAEWGNGDKEYLKNLFDQTRHQDDFLEKVLEPLFFGTLNKDRRTEKYIADDVLAINGCKVRIPYLNGGLFEKDKLDKAKIKFPSEYFDGLFDTFERYNFTIDENDPDDKEVGVDPEMLGRIFENLLEDNKDKGAFYTPKEIVQYMCEESLIAYLGDTEANRKLVKEFDASGITNASELLAKLQDVKICDPAIGSGAFPMGMLNILYRIRLILEDKDFSPENIVAVKKEIIQNNIYGVDIEAGAVDIARLRFWLSIVVDEDKPIPLPNLDYKIMQGNSLLEQYDGVDLSQICNKFMVSESSANQKKKGKKKTADDNEASLLDLFDDTLCTPDVMHKAMDYYFSIQQHNLKAQYKERINGKVLNCIKTALKQDSIEIDWNNNSEFFLWHTYFWDVFNKKGGFDIVIGNPPYFVYQSTHTNEIKNLRNLKIYEITQDGKLNAYKLFLALAIKKLARPAGITTFIFQNSFLGDQSAYGLRNFIFNDRKLLKIDSFPERDNVKRRVFKDVKMSVCIAIIKNEKSNSHFLLNVWRDRYMTSGYQTYFSYEEIRNIDPDNLNIPYLKRNDIPLVVKMKRVPHINAKCFEGELNVTNHKKFFTTDKNLPVIYKGACIQRFFITENSSQGKIEYLDEAGYLNSAKSSEKAQHHTLTRIAMQGISGVDDKRRLIMALVSPGYYLANSCNYILPIENIDIYALLGLFNSSLTNWFFKRFSTNSNVNGYEIDNIPIPEYNTTTKEHYKKLSDISFLITQKKAINAQEDTSYLEEQIDNIVYALYNLTDEEIAIVEESLKKSVAIEGRKKRGKKAAAVPAEPVIDDVNDEVDGDI